MSTITPQTVNAWRARSVWLFRVLAVLATALGAYLFLKRVTLGIGVSQAEMIHKVWEGIGESHSFYQGLALLIVGPLLGSLAPTLARWAIVPPANTCPSCGYTPAPTTTPCPECGLTPS